MLPNTSDCELILARDVEHKCFMINIQGTVKPTKYTIIVNDCRWSKNEIMNVTYHLAFAHQVSYAPPAIPNVSYAAQNLAKRGHNNYKTHT